ncbi:type VII secretion protein EccE [Candidatus Mycobacterium methanotrophicum]|uniref:Type VII secretion protein EccE n=1 Tax=Candidatus Mycobacterium methanotrophicum TaxID=2943498 RepID=A0ABY4QR36_9MYCO|nr:type VII secretion protein EccE [Candidatus Mycobacterium methanotrophicum]UQX13423.1 type VII secretion protein EccE [Candidatus Mycobacterium methanotrophicum]
MTTSSGGGGFTKPPMVGMRVTLARTVVITLTLMAWVVATRGRLHPAAVAAVPVVVLLVAFVTIYHVALTHWVATWWSWLRQRRSLTLAAAPRAHDVLLGDVPVGVLTENEQLITLIELHGDPLAPSVVSETEERTINVLSIAGLSAIIAGVLDVDVSSADFLCNGFRAAGGFAAHYQQMTGPTVGPADRHGWIIVRVGLHDNLAAIDRRGGDAAAADQLAAATCLRIADTLASSGLDARPACAQDIDDLNTLLSADIPTVDHWAYLENRSGYTGVYYADPAHLGEDAPQWWTWALSRAVTTLVRLTPQSDGSTSVAALVRYRTDAPTAAPPVSRLGPLYGTQTAMWQQFRVGYLPVEAPLPAAPLGADTALPFGPAGPLIGSIGDPRDHTSVHLPLSGPITVLCQSPLLLRQVTLRATTTGRPVVVITDEPEKWKPIVALAVGGEILDDYPAGWVSTDDDTDPDVDDATAPASPAPDFGAIDPATMLVIDTERDWPDHLPQLTVLTNDEACDADIELVDTDDQFGFTLKIRTGLSARIPSVPAHEERRILGVNPPPSPARSITRRAERPTSPPRRPTPGPPARIGPQVRVDLADDLTAGSDGQGAGPPVARSHTPPTGPPATADPEATGHPARPPSPPRPSDPARPTFADPGPRAARPPRPRFVWPHRPDPSSATPPSQQAWPPADRPIPRPPGVPHRNAPPPPEGTDPASPGRHRGPDGNADQGTDRNGDRSDADPDIPASGNPGPPPTRSAEHREDT